MSKYFSAAVLLIIVFVTIDYLDLRDDCIEGVRQALYEIKRTYRALGSQFG